MAEAFICAYRRTPIGRFGGALGIADDAAHFDLNGGAIALGHPLGMSGARLVGTVAQEQRFTDTRLAPATMCIGVVQGIALEVT